MSGALGLLLLLIGAGVLGGLYIATAPATGARLKLAWAMWLSVPFIIVAFAFGRQFVFVSIVVAVPWLGANLIGWLIGRLFPSRKVAAVFAGPPKSLVREGSPDWTRADDPSLSHAQLGELMYAIADRAGVPRRVLPAIGPIGAGEGEFIDRDKFDYIYIGLERGQPMFDLRTVIADQLMYWVFCDRAWVLASNRLANARQAGERFPDQEYAGRLSKGQRAILAEIDPKWARQFDSERGQSAGGGPF